LSKWHARLRRREASPERRIDVAERSYLRAVIGFAVSGVAAHVKVAARKVLDELEPERIVAPYSLRLPA
jgi:hypothetical protein